MERTRWELTQRIFHEALERAGEDRERFLAEACPDDRLRAEVRAMIDHDAAGVSLLEAGLPAVAHAALEDDAAARRLLHTDIGPYRIVAVLGEGGMGVVYRAERAVVGGLAAVKVLRHGWMSPARRERFHAEQRVLAQLNHPAIAQLYDADVLPDGTPWFAMEFVDGLPLTEYCERYEDTIRGRLELFRTVCEAVQHAHGHLIVHRDLKPSNIFVRPDGRVKLLDFGISKQLDPDGPIDQTATTFRLMTPAYAAPEQIRGGRTGVHTDVYALGVVLYELLARQRPFDLSQRSPREAESILLETDAVRPSLVAGRLPASRAAWSDLNVLCLTAMRKEPERRYPTVDALLRDVDRYLAGKPLDARRDAMTYRAGKFLRRQWRGVAAAAAVLAVVVTLSAYYAWNLALARRAAEQEAARTGRIQQFMFNLFEGGDPAAGPANDLRVITLIDRGLAQAGELDREPQVQADLFQALGGISQKLGEFSQAERAMRAALDLRLALYGERAVPVAESRIELALLKVDQAQLDEAEQLVRQGLVTVDEAAAPPLVRARATAALGVVLEARGDYQQAITVNETAVRLFEEADELGAGHTAALGQLADSHYYAGHHDVADGINQQVLEANRRLYGPTHPKVADVLINLGASQTDRGRYSAAEPYYRQALAALAAFHGPEHFRTASATTMLARALVYQKRFDEGVPLLQQALRVQERVNGPAHPRVASALNDLGVAALQQNQFAEAEASFRRMLDIYRTVYTAEHYLHGIATSNLASVFSARHEYARAEPLFREAIGIYERTQSPTHLNTAIGRVKLGRVLLRLGRPHEAERDLLAGLQILQAQASPSVSWISSARADLAELYERLQQPAEAAKYK